MANKKKSTKKSTNKKNNSTLKANTQMTNKNLTKKETTSKSEKTNKELKNKNIKSSEKTQKNITPKAEVLIYKEGKKKDKKKIFKFIIPLLIILILLFVIFLYLLLRPKFKDVTIELGTDNIGVETFLVSNMYKKNAKFITDLDTIDLNTVQETEITLAYNNKEEKVKLNIVDTTAPDVEFQDITKNIDYEINVEDFIISKSDYSKMEVELLSEIEINEYKDYTVSISVTDEYGNVTTGECTLTISWINLNVVVELGEEFTIDDLILDVDTYKDYIDEERIEEVDTSKVGEYTIDVEYNNRVYTSNIIVQDTTAPTLTLKKLSIYDDETSLDYKKFIKKVSDESGEVTTTLKTDIDFSKIGKQDITIEATDINGNTTTKTTTLTIKKDTVGPVFSGLSTLSVKKNATINYTSGVKAVDAKDGTVTFTVDSSNVKIDTAGTYYVKYTATDKSGNKTTKKRTVTVAHDSSDTEAKFNSFYNSYLAGKGPAAMAKEIWNRIKGTSAWGGDDPVWYGLTNGNGNCYVHAKILAKALTKAGYENKIIYTTNKSHYWNLVKVNGTWYHLDSTPRYDTSLKTGTQKLGSPELGGGTWDTEAFPEANT